MSVLRTTVTLPDETHRDRRRGRPGRAGARAPRRAASPGSLVVSVAPMLEGADHSAGAFVDPSSGFVVLHRRRAALAVGVDRVGGTADVGSVDGDGDDVAHVAPLVGPARVGARRRHPRRRGVRRDPVRGARPGPAPRRRRRGGTREAPARRRAPAGRDGGRVRRRQRPRPPRAALGARARAAHRPGDRRDRRGARDGRGLHRVRRLRVRLAARPRVRRARPARGRVRRRCDGRPALARPLAGARGPLAAPLLDDRRAGALVGPPSDRRDRRRAGRGRGRLLGARGRGRSTASSGPSSAAPQTSSSRSSTRRPASRGRAPTSGSSTTASTRTRRRPSSAGCAPPPSPPRATSRRSPAATPVTASRVAAAIDACLWDAALGRYRRGVSVARPDRAGEPPASAFERSLPYPNRRVQSVDAVDARLDSSLLGLAWPFAPFGLGRSGSGRRSTPSRRGLADARRRASPARGRHRTAAATSGRSRLWLGLARRALGDEEAASRGRSRTSSDGGRRSTSCRSRSARRQPAWVAAARLEPRDAARRRAAGARLVRRCARGRMPATAEGDDRRRAPPRIDPWTARREGAAPRSRVYASRA